jgi:2-dehydro-3-deoxy-D-arabinonate dehydratase
LEKTTKEDSVQLCRYTDGTGGDEPRLGLVVDGRIVDVAAAGGPKSLAEALRLPLDQFIETLVKIAGSPGDGPGAASVSMLAPIDEQEVWAAGVTYLRSRDARMEESQQKDVYDQVYEAARPEIFFKATPNRVAAPGTPVAVRGDSGWDVPEPELVLVLNSAGEIVGYTIGNDVSSRTIEGENPLYLPQAKLYSRSAALGPVIVTVDEMADPNGLPIELVIRRNDEVLFQDATSTAQLHRMPYDLVSYLMRCNEFPNGAFLMTGTGIVPPSEFTLQDGDEVTISIGGIGSLVNPVIRIPV